MNNPPWVSKIVSSHCKPIEEAAKRHDLPMPAMKGDCIVADELGVGHYGAVYKTDKEGVVFKVTSDEDEAHFVATAIKLRDASPSVNPEGIVQYYAIYALPGQHRSRNTYVLWREEATSVGLPRGQGKGMTYDQKETETMLMRFKYMAHEAKVIADRKVKKAESEGAQSYWDWMKSQRDLHDQMVNHYGETYGEEVTRSNEWGSYRYGDARTEWLMKQYSGVGWGRNRFAWLIAACSQVAVEMENANGMVYLLGGALGEYLEAGLLLADVHAQNVGLVPRYSYSYVITDPGHCVVLDPKLSEMGIPKL